jgi:DNA repair exonuclease SbcCD nuclease subunit
MRLIHTADWQIGKVFRFAGEATMHLLQEARLAAISTIGQLAIEHAAGHVLVAGDVYDGADVGDHVLRQPLERMRRFASVAWHLIPGNHDPHRPGGVWDRLRAQDLPENVHLQLEPAAVALDAATQLLPAPLVRRQSVDDPTAWMNAAATPEGSIRIGLAHGSVTQFGSGDAVAANLIAPDRARQAGLAYLALGDWHGMKRIGPRCWYAGTPEVDSFGVVEGGRALLVEVAAAAADPVVTPLEVGRYQWRQEHARLAGPADIDRLDQQIRGLAADPARLLVDLRVEGALALDQRAGFERQIEGLRAALCHLRLDQRQLVSVPSVDDLDAIATGGFLRVAAERLQALAAAPTDAESEPEQGAHDREIAAEALLRLYLLRREHLPT